MEERMKREEQEYEERKRKEEYEERKRKEECEGRKRKDEMEFELQKIRLGVKGRFSNSVADQNVISTQIKPKLELHHLMQKFNSDENDTSLYLIMFERLAKQAEILENTWIKRKVSQEVKDHLIEDWSKLNSPDDLVEKLDNYDTLRSTFRSKQPHKEGQYDKRNSFKDDTAFTTKEKKALRYYT
ncbi:hypothetical protein AVEN_215066-1 [Araneus ventricosus]|uniref:Uncharacterized protein n=1 Tax=Araneus ventricosus TaxID=182803 RepID=A0A4Y2RVC6_ARAVE|nr:hypothetical protein AVEN_75755-1 [Araneus ventricosus]GBN79354.1 hypothetical protein AVEN_215066-1 [Araneus ventricosus]